MKAKAALAKPKTQTKAKAAEKKSLEKKSSDTTVKKVVAKTAAKAANKTATKATAKNPKESATTIKESNQSKKGSPSLVSRGIAQEEMRSLCKKYPDAECELTYKNDYELLTSVILSAQTTDVQVNKVTPALFKKFPTPKSLAEANPEEVKEIIKPTGYYNNKAKSIQTCAATVLEKFGGKVPNTLEDLTTLPGVGRKTANVVLGVIHKVPGWTVDTHVQRLSQRLGFTANTDPYKIEMDLQKLFPEEDWTKYSITLIWHGRRQCYARNPDCINCPIKHLCPSSLAP